MKRLLYYLLVVSAFTYKVCGDSIVLVTGRAIDGTVIQTNADDVLLLTDCATLRFARENIKRITIDRLQPRVVSKERIADSKAAIELLSKQGWATTMKQIPATVIDKGILRNVPYISFRCGSDYEVNIYGDLDHPAGIEAGVYRSLLEDKSAKKNCLTFISSILPQSSDKEIAKGLKLAKDKTLQNGLTFEITPPTDEDSYQGWWISIYDEEKLEKARASDEELNAITVANGNAGKWAMVEDDLPTGWTPGELQLARPSQPNTISFTTASGTTVNNAQVVRIIDGVSLVWRDGASGGLVKLAELPPDVQKLYGYDAAKSAAADAAEKERKARERQAQIQAAQAQAQVASVQSVSDDSASYSGYSGSYGGGGGRVYVRGYQRKDGTYVHAHTRSAPHR